MPSKSSAFPAIKEAFDALADNREEFTAVVRPVTDPTTGLRTTSRTSRKTSKSATSVTGPSYTRFLSTISRDDYQNIFHLLGRGESRERREIILGDSPHNHTPEIAFYRYALPKDTFDNLRSRTLPAQHDADLWCDIKIRLMSEAGGVLGVATVYLAMNTMPSNERDLQPYYMGPILRSFGLSSPRRYNISRSKIGSSGTIDPQFLINGRLEAGPALLVTKGVG